VELKSSDPERLREGFRATVLIPLETLSNVVYVPRQAVSVQNGKTMVRCNRGGADALVEVKLGTESNGQVVVQEGLNEGDLVWTPPAPAAPEPKKMPEMPKKAETPKKKATQKPATDGKTEAPADPNAEKKPEEKTDDKTKKKRSGNSDDWDFRGGKLPPGHP
jgi:hypothetical protein